MTASSRGVCYGFEVHSDIDFLFLRSGLGQPLHVCEGSRKRTGPPQSELVQEWSEIPGKRMRTRLGSTDGGYVIEIGDLHWFQLDQGPSPRVILSPTSDSRGRELALWTTPAALNIALRGDLPLHAASVDLGGTAVLVTAPSGFGKTTAAVALLARGHRVLADDLSCVTLAGDPQVLSGPAIVRATHETVSHKFDLSATQRDWEDELKVYLALKDAARGTGDPVPLGGIVFLRPGGQLRATRSQSAAAVRDLWAMAFYLRDDASRARCFQNITQLVAKVPAWDVSREHDWETVPELADTIAQLVSGR